MSKLELVVEQGGLAGQVISLEQPAVIIGRGGDAPARRQAEGRIGLPEEGVSRQHARIQAGPEGWVLTDLGSTNGTYLNGQRLRAHEPHPLRPGDRVGLAGAVLLVREVRETERPVEAAPRGRPAKRAPHPAILVAGAFLLVIVLVGIVILLVTVLQPAPEVTTPTPGAQMEELIATVVPTEFQEVVTAMAPLLTSLPLPPLGPASTPTP